jgi:hypothetical protein
MTSAHTIAVWPAEVAAPFDDLHDTLDRLLPDHDIASFDDLDDLTTILSERDPDAVVLVIDPESSASISDRTIAMVLTTLQEHPEVSVAVVAGDGCLGTDGVIDPSCLLGAMAVSGVRSLALRRHRPGRSNVVCVPQSAYDRSASLRGPIAQPTETVDIANALAFLIDETGRYVSGDVMYVNGGRHLFSSHTA